ncbi:excalibur calcium-binding domain-containing protein [Bacillus amyloliquefaciens]|uniref:Excalibur calcium-binding domain-containing protein n=1 Tax=Bacillus amyloliquefaciens TaxID=1390 RepID=A0AAP7TD12_BACAM|nr:excalibur calcium-binding domain-containing protein [Bacillus amyloliquefaciens]OIK23017.1 hypothetical protein BKP66_03460 [Bacillus amyloliquefaciens]RDY83897.1 hypothetical protein C3733_18655 [Bacillus amyloliquefaciens]
MNKLIAGFVSLGLLVGVTYSNPDVADAKTKVKAYANCKALNKDYKHGVGRYKGVKNKGGKPVKPYISKALYDKNKRLDRDKDNIACER